MHVYQDVNMHVCHLTSQFVYKFSVFQIRDGSRVKTPMATATWPDTDEKENHFVKFYYEFSVPESILR